MIKVFIESISKNIELKTGLYRIILENPNLYRNIAINIESEIVISYDNKTIPFEKAAVAIYDPFNIDLNDSKNIKILYKLLEREIHESYGDELRNIEHLLFDMSEKLILSSNVNIDYEPQVDISKLLSCFGIKYVVYDEYLLNLIQFIRIQHELFSKKIVLFFGLSTVLNEEEFEMFNEELIKNEFKVLDISFYPKNTKTDNSLIIDEDWCIL